MHPRRSEGLKTAIAFCCLMLSAFLNFFLLTVIHDVVPRQPLPDLTFMIIPQQKWAWSVGDVLSTVRCVSILFLDESWIFHHCLKIFSALWWRSQSYFFIKNDGLFCVVCSSLVRLCTGCELLFWEWVQISGQIGYWTSCPFCIASSCRLYAVILNFIFFWVSYHVESLIGLENNTIRKDVHCKSKYFPLLKIWIYFRWLSFPLLFMTEMRSASRKWTARLCMGWKLRLG